MRKRKKLPEIPAEARASIHYNDVICINAHDYFLEDEGDRAILAAYMSNICEELAERFHDVALASNIKKDMEGYSFCMEAWDYFRQLRIAWLKFGGWRQ